MKIHTFQQHSDEWENIRKGKITASIFKDLITNKKLEVSDTKTAKKTIAKIVANKLCWQNSDTFENYAMAKGIDCEPRARQLYEEKQFCQVQEVGFIEDESGYAGFSPDGLVDGGMIEIKTQCQAKHFYCKLFGFDEWLAEYKPQILFSMAVCNDIKFCDCISYNEDFREIENKIIIYRYERNEEEVAKVREVINYWINFLKSL
jgi:hypothetical protein